MTVEELEARIKTLEDQIRTLQDIEEIKKLQRAYGFYLEHWMAEDIIDLFSDSDDATVLVAAGEFRGKENIRTFFHHGKKDIEIKSQDNPEFLHQVMQLSGVVDVDPDGKTAKGRWYGFGANAFPMEGGINPGWMNGVYENEYVKEDGKWKILKIHWCMTFHAPYKEGWVDPSKHKHVVKFMNRPYPSPMLSPDGPPEETQYPSGFICPFHFKNPVSGRQSY